MFCGYHLTIGYIKTIWAIKLTTLCFYCSKKVSWAFGFGRNDCISENTAKWSEVSNN